MKLLRLVITVGIFFFCSQGITVFLFRKMIEFAVDQKLPIDELVTYQMIIMKIVVGSMIVLGALFMILVIAFIYRAVRSQDPVMVPFEVNREA